MPSIDINSNTPRQQFTATSGQTVFNVNFVIFNQIDCKVFNENVEIANGDFTVTNLSNESGATITLDIGATTGDVITIFRETVISRNSQYQQDGRLDAAPLEKDFDTITTVLQELKLDIERKLGIPVSDENTTDVITLLQDAITGSTEAQTAAELAETGAETAETGAVNAQAYAQDWAIEVEDTPISVAAGGDNSTTFSALHWAAKAQDAVNGFKVSSNDTTPSDLETKLLVGAGLSLSTQNEGANETRTINHAFATQAEAEAGTATDKPMNALRTKQAIDALAPNALPVGTTIIWNDDTPPDDYLEEDGSAISRTTFADLFSVLGSTYGSGDGTTTFNLPDLRGEFIRGWDNGAGVDSGRSLGSSQADEFKSHTHGVEGNVGTGSGLGLVPDGSTIFVQTESSGGSETRPRNIAKMFCIKYR